MTVIPVDSNSCCIYSYVQRLAAVNSNSCHIYSYVQRLAAVNSNSCRIYSYVQRLAETLYIGINMTVIPGRHWIGGKKGGKFVLPGIFFGAKIILVMIRHIFSFSRVECSFTFDDHASVPPIFANLYQTDQSYTKLYQTIPRYQTIPN
jgi:hypothetical protein